MCPCACCTADPNWMYCLCSSCGGEKDAEGNCARYCLDEPSTWLELELPKHEVGSDGSA